jgi:hypothetical protein
VRLMPTIPSSDTRNQWSELGSNSLLDGCEGLLPVACGSLLVAVIAGVTGVFESPASVTDSGSALDALPDAS